MRGQNQARLSILIVEDRSDCAESLAMLLRMHGHEVEIAANGFTALESELSRHHDVILVDIDLPGLDGWQVAKRIKAYPSPKRPFIIAVTGYGRDEDRQQSAEAGIDLHLTKPVDVSRLHVAISELATVTH